MVLAGFHGRKKNLLRLGVILIVFWPGFLPAAQPEVCVYIAEQGQAVQVSSRKAVPAKFRDQARCFEQKKKAGSYLADPQDVTLKGAVREENMNSALGRVKLRWPRSAEVLFGRTPQRAMTDAAHTVSRALKQSGFPPAIQNLRLEWNVVFIDSEMREAEIPKYLIAGCHPGWMVPPANIYIVAERVAGGCGGSRGGNARVADSQLAQVIVHEMGHAVEFQLLPRQSGLDRLRSEGFASWFEQYAADFSAVIPRRQVAEAQLPLAKQAFGSNLGYFDFTGSAEDYAKAAMIFRAIVDRRGVSGLISVYKVMNSDNLSFCEAVRRSLGWDERRLGKELERMLR